MKRNFVLESDASSAITPPEQGEPHIADVQGSVGPGNEIRRLREERGLRPVDVQRISEMIRSRKNCADFLIAHATLNDIENGQSIPSVRKMFSLASSLQIPLESILTLYDADPGEVKNYYDRPDPEGTRIAPLDSAFVLPFDRAFDFRRTGPIDGDIMQWQGLPYTLRERLDATRYKYAWVGTEDDSMADLIPPGSLIEIDRNQTNIEVANWSSLRERPIYFSWTRDGYRCSWCEAVDDELVLLPHPASHAQVMIFRTRRESTIVGRVTFAWVPFGNPLAR